MFRSLPVFRAGCPGPGPRPCFWSFNPHPTFRPDATRRLPRGPRSAPRFNPHPTFRPDATSSFAASKGTSRCFNPHPTFRPNATAPVDRRAPHLQVSILIRPSGRMQQGYLREKIDSAQFQSSSDLQAGCNHDGGGPGRLDVQRVSILIRPSGRMQPEVNRAMAMAVARFQSSSDLQAGCNLGRGRLRSRRGHVSILIRPSGRMQPVMAEDVGLVPGVSILIRPSGRMQPERRPGGAAGVGPVSILIRPSGRMQPAGAVHSSATWVFQSSSDLQAGCNRRGSTSETAWPSRFQSSSDLQAGCNPVMEYLLRPSNPFQSSSDLQAGCNLHPPDHQRRGDSRFNPHPTFRPDATYIRLTISGVAIHVSILIRPSGRMQPWRRGWLHWWALLRFNPHPTFRPDATP